MYSIAVVLGMDIDFFAQICFPDDIVDGCDLSCRGEGRKHDVEWREEDEGRGIRDIYAGSLFGFLFVSRMFHVHANNQTVLCWSVWYNSSCFGHLLGVPILLSKIANSRDGLHVMQFVARVATGQCLAKHVLFMSPLP